MIRQRVRLIVLRLAGGLLRPRLPHRVPAPAAPRSILIIRPDHLGDVLLTRPAIERLRQAFPAARVVVATGPWGRASLGDHPGFEVMTCPFPGFSRGQGKNTRAYRLLIALAFRLRRRRFDVALIMRPDHWWGAWLAALAGIPVRIGYATPETSPFLTETLPLSPRKHSAEASIDLVDVLIGRTGANPAPVGLPFLPGLATFSDEVAAALLLRGASLDRQPYIVLHPGSGSGLKSWPAERFASLGEQLIGEHFPDTRVVITGSTEELPLALALCERLPGAVNLAGKLQWGELEVVLRRASFVVGVDNGSLHLAVAAGTQSVALFGPADPHQFGPWGDPARHAVVAADLPCRPCRRLDVCRLEPGVNGPPPCMRAITVAQVLAVCDTLLAGRR